MSDSIRGHRKMEEKPPGGCARLNMQYYDNYEAKDKKDLQNLVKWILFLVFLWTTKL